MRISCTPFGLGKRKKRCFTFHNWSRPSRYRLAAESKIYSGLFEAVRPTSSCVSNSFESTVSVSSERSQSAKSAPLRFKCSCKVREELVPSVRITTCRLTGVALACPIESSYFARCFGSFRIRTWGDLHSNWYKEGPSAMATPVILASFIQTKPPPGESGSDAANTSRKACSRLEKT